VLFRSIIGTEGNDIIKALAGNDWVTGEAGDDVLVGGAGDDDLDGGTGSDILSGGSGWDTLFADRGYSYPGNDLLAGGADGDNLNASISNDLLIGGTGNDDVIGDDGNDVMLFNRGDGNDWYGVDCSENGVALAQRTDTVSLGGGIGYADLSFERDAWDGLILNLGNGESIYFEAWFDATWQNNKAICTLQIIAEAMAEYSAQSPDALLNKRAQQFDFADNLGDGQAEAKSGDGQVGAFQPKGRQAQQKAEGGRDQGRGNQGRQKGQMGLGHQRDGAVSPHGVKTGMAQGYLAGEAHQQIKAHHHDNIDGDVVGHIDIVVLGEKREGRQEGPQHHKPENNNSRGKDLHVLIVVALHVHRRCPVIKKSDEGARVDPA